MRTHIDGYFDQIRAAIDSVSREDIEKAAHMLYDCYKRDGSVFVIGNGGSASTASHVACDLGKGTLKNVYHPHERRFRVMSLTDNVALITAFGNDLSYDDIFSQQLKNLVKPGDVVLAITGSGNSRNIINGVKTAKEHGAITLGFLGFGGGKVMDLLDHCIHVKSGHYGVVEDVHLMLQHMIADYLAKLKAEEYTETLSKSNAS